MLEDEDETEQRVKLEGYCATLLEELSKLGQQAEIRRVRHCQCPRVYIEDRMMAAVTYEEELVDARLIVRPAWAMDERPQSYPVPPDLPRAAATIVRWRERVLELERRGRAALEAKRASAGKQTDG